MAVPKKRTSKAKTNNRKTVWKKIALKQSIKAYSLYSLALKRLLDSKSPSPELADDSKQS